MSRSELPYVLHMLDAADRLERYLKGVDQLQFEEDEILQDAVVRQLEILGEAAGKVPKEVSDAHPEVPWSSMTGMRHKLIHDYFIVDLEVVWTTATQDVPSVRASLEALREALES